MKPAGIIPIPQIDNWDTFQMNRERADEKGLNHCPCCGKAIKNPKWFINSIYGGSAYPSNGPDPDTIKDAWIMAVGSECRKRFPDGYTFKL